MLGSQVRLLAVAPIFFNIIFGFAFVAKADQQTFSLAAKFSVEKCSFQPPFQLGCSVTGEPERVSIGTKDCFQIGEGKFCSGKWTKEQVRDDQYFSIQLNYQKEYDKSGVLIAETIYGVLQSGKEADVSTTNFIIYLDNSKLTVPVRIGGRYIKLDDEVPNKYHTYTPQILIKP